MHKLLSTTALILTLAVCGTSYAQDQGPGVHEGHPIFMDGALSKLPPADADKFRAAMKQAHAQEKPTMEKIHALHEEIDAILKAPTFDKAAFLKKSDQLQHLVESAHHAMTKSFADAVAQLPQDERVTLAENMPHRGEGRHEHGPHHLHGGGNVAPDGEDHDPASPAKND